MKVKGDVLLRGDTSANWQSKNPVLKDRELGLETDTGRYKIGDGSTSWSQLTNYYTTKQEIEDLIRTVLVSISPGGDVSSTAFEYIQSTPSASWIIEVPLTLTRRPNISVYIEDHLVFADVFVTPDVINVSFPSPVTGSAVIS